MGKVGGGKYFNYWELPGEDIVPGLPPGEGPLPPPWAFFAIRLCSISMFSSPLGYSTGLLNLASRSGGTRNSSGAAGGLLGS